MIEISSDLPIIVEISGRSACGKITEICCPGRLYCKLCQLGEMAAEEFAGFYLMRKY